MPAPARPPRLAEWLVRVAAPPAESASVVGDFRDAFDERVQSLGQVRARKWYWKETLWSVAPLGGLRLRSAPRPRVSPRTGDHMWSQIFADIRYALRLSGRSPLAACTIVGTMALGIGATTAVFNATNAVLLRPLPFAASTRVVSLSGVLRDGQVIESVAYPDIADFRRGVADFSDIAVFQRNDLTLQHGSDPQLVRSIQVDDVYPRVFGMRPALGRLLAASDMTLNAAKVVVLSHDFWMREFGGDSALLSHTITLNNEPVQVVGILAKDAYLFPRPADLLAPLVIFPNSIMTQRGAMWASAVAMLKPGASIEQAQRDLTAATRSIEKEFPNANQGIGSHIESLRDAVVGPVRSMLQLLSAAVAAVLLIAAVNIANLILGRAQARSREFAVRAALGGSPSRVRRQILTESLVLAAIGGVLGVLMAPLLTRGLVSVYPDSLPRADEIGLSPTVLLVAAFATMIAGGCAAVPTLRHAMRGRLANDLRDGGRSGTGRGERRAGRVLVVTQVAASLALLFSAGLLLQTFWRLTGVDPGFNPHHVTAFHVYVPSAAYQQNRDVDGFLTNATSALAAIPGVESVSNTTLLPFGGSRFYDVFVPAEVGDRAPHNPAAAVSVVRPGFERALGIRLIAGRAFTAQDDSAAALVVMVNEAIAKKTYPGVDPVGRFIIWSGKTPRRIVGVVATTHINTLWEDPFPILYAPELQATRRSIYFVVRSSLPSAQVISGAHAALRRIAPGIAVTDVATMEERIQNSLGAQRFRAALMATIGALALVLAVIGIYGVVAYSVTRRIREIGIRMALGEASGDIRRRVVIDAFRAAGAGIALGIALALMCGRWLTTFLVGVNPHDGALLGAAAGLLAAVVFVAAYGPARRAAQVDPVTALRGE